MKNLIFLGVASALLCACNDSLENTFLLADGDSKMTRSVISEVSPVFAWDDTTHISLYNVPGPVLLPWYSGAATSIPSFILDSYKASDGWQLVYNTCSPSNITQDDLYYLLFYNIFSGKLRGYVYNKNDVYLGSEYKELKYFNVDETINYEINFNYKDVNKVKLQIIDEIPKNNDNTKESETTVGGVEVEPIVDEYTMKIAVPIAGILILYTILPV